MFSPVPLVHFCNSPKPYSFCITWTRAIQVIIKQFHNQTFGQTFAAATTILSSPSISLIPRYSPYEMAVFSRDSRPFRKSTAKRYVAPSSRPANETRPSWADRAPATKLLDAEVNEERLGRGEAGPPLIPDTVAKRIGDPARPGRGP